MKLLAFDTSSVACTVAVTADGVVVERHEEKAREHTRILMPMIRSCLEEADLALTDLDAIVVGNGPGSFIGMRIAASVAQGLAHGAGLDLVPVSSMAAVAARAGSVGDNVAVAQDAHMNEVYFGFYRIDEDSLPQPAIEERLHDQGKIPELDLLPGRVIAAGSGWQRYPRLLEANRDRIDAVSEVLYPNARELLDLGGASLDAGLNIPPESLEPAYLRQKVAQKTAERMS